MSAPCCARPPTPRSPRRSSATLARRRLRAAGYEPAWFELDVEVEDEGATDSQFGVVWAEPGLSREALANDELEQALEATLQGLRDFEGIEVERDEIPDEAIELRIED